RNLNWLADWFHSEKSTEFEYLSENSKFRGYRNRLDFGPSLGVALKRHRSSANRVVWLTE
ncbi:hypothetical protein PIB30_053005, partial [Stylosanthes scabra]|nr:hypothetical protein [Stylosanthes scabra]